MHDCYHVNSMGFLDENEPVWELANRCDSCPNQMRRTRLGSIRDPFGGDFERSLETIGHETADPNVAMEGFAEFLFREWVQFN